MPPVARDDVGRTDSGATVRCRRRTTTSIPMAMRSAWSTLRPPPMAPSQHRACSSISTRPRLRGDRNDHLPPPRRHGLLSLGTARVWVDSGVAGSRVAARRHQDYAVVYQGASVGFTTAQLLANDDDPQGMRRCRWWRSRNLPRRCPERHARGRVHLYPQRRPRSVDTDHGSTTSSPTPTATSPRAARRSASSPPATPTIHRLRVMMWRVPTAAAR